MNYEKRNLFSVSKGKFAQIVSGLNPAPQKPPLAGTLVSGVLVVMYEAATPKESNKMAMTTVIETKRHMETTGDRRLEPLAGPIRLRPSGKPTAPGKKVRAVAEAIVVTIAEQCLEKCGNDALVGIELHVEVAAQ
jgi:hypothetical protein